METLWFSQRSCSQDRQNRNHLLTNMNNPSTKIRSRWGLLRSAVLLRAKSGSKVSAKDEKCSPKLSFPYPHEFLKPNYPNEFVRPSYPTEFAKPCYPTEFEKPHFPNNFTKPSQMQTPTQTDLAEPSTMLSRWDQVIQQLLIQSNGGKGQTDASGTEPERPPASYSPPLPPPDGPVPPPEFTYMSPANGSDADAAETDFENTQSPPPRYFRWNTNSEWMIQADKDK